MSDNKRKMIDIKIANYIFRIYPHYVELFDFFENYEVKSDYYDFEIRVSRDEAMYERENGEVKDMNLLICEFLAIYRKMAIELIEKKVFLIHGVLLQVNGEGYLFTAKSGTGKTTHTRLWMDLLGNQAKIINGDKPFCYFQDGKLYGCGTPCNGKEGYGVNEITSIRAIGLIERSENNSTEIMSESDAFMYLIQQAFKPTDVKKMEDVIEFVNQLVRQVPTYKIKCNMDIEAAKIAYQAMSK